MIEYNSVLDRCFHRVNIRPSLTFIIKIPKNNTTQKNGIVTAALRDGAIEESSLTRHSV